MMVRTVVYQLGFIKGHVRSWRRPHRDEQHGKIGRGGWVAGGAHALHIHRVPRVLGYRVHMRKSYMFYHIWLGREVRCFNE